MLIEKTEKHKGNPRAFYKYCKTIKMGQIPKTQFMEDEKGDIITSSEQIAEKFKEYFDKLLNTSVTNNEEGNGENIVHNTMKPEVRIPNWNEIQQSIC